MQEIKKTIGEFFSSSSSSSQQPNIITSLGQTSIIRPIIPPPVTTTPLQPTPPQPAQSSQEQKKKENINPLTTFGANLFNTSTFMAEDPHRTARGVGEGGEDAIIIPQEPSLLPYMRTTTSDNNNYSKKRGEPNPITENKEEKQEFITGSILNAAFIITCKSSLFSLSCLMLRRYIPPRLACSYL